MPLNLGGGGQFTPHIRWMASVSAWAISVDGGQPVTCHLQQFLCDLWNIRTGWCYFPQGEAPQWVLDNSLTDPAPKPDDNFSRAFAVNLYNSQVFDGVNLREFATSAIGASMGIQSLYEAFERESPGHTRGELPIVEYSGAVPTKVGKGNTNVPQMKIIGWHPRPTDCPDEPPMKGQEAQPTAQAPAQAPAQSVPAPAAAPVAAQAPAQQPINPSGQMF